MKINIIFYSTYGHVYQLANAIAEGVAQVEGADANIFQVPEILSDETIEMMHATEAKKAFAHVRTATLTSLSEADAIIFGSPTRFGMIAAQMKSFFDSTGGLWLQGALVDKVGSVFTSAATQHGGQESTILSFHTSLLHHGMIIVGVPYSEGRLMGIEEVSGGSPYGASTIAGADGSRQPSENELAIASFQGKHVAEITKRLKR